MDSIKNEPNLFHQFDKSIDGRCDASIIVLFDASQTIIKSTTQYVSFTVGLLSKGNRINASGYYWDTEFENKQKLVEVLMTPIIMLPFVEPTTPIENVNKVFVKRLDKMFKVLSEALIKINLEGSRK